MTGLPRYRKVEKTCPQCNKVFSVKPSHAETRVYCSKSCMALAYAKRLQGSQNPHFVIENEKICERCGASYHSSIKTRRYCSQSCASLVNSNLPKNYRKKSKPQQVKEIEPTICSVCGVEIPTSHRKYENCKTKPQLMSLVCMVCGKHFNYHIFKKTCSRQCFGKQIAIRQQGEQSHLWQGGKTSEAAKLRNSYTYKTWRTAVYERDNYTCQMCEQRGGKLAAHHIKPFSTNRHIALELWNGITLCWECHNSIKGKETQYESQFYQHTKPILILRSAEQALREIGATD